MTVGEWIEKSCPNIPSLEDNPPWLAKRFVTMNLCKTLTCREEWIIKYMNKFGIKSAREAIEFVIVNIDYPLRFGFIPTDKHVWNAFNGKACFKLDLDYWQTAWETLMTYILNSKYYGRRGYGDCEDTSILTASLLRLLGYDAYVYFGTVYLKEGGRLRLLGGHGWCISELDDKKYHLIETTLDIPLPYPSGYPEVDLNAERYVIKANDKALIYVPHVRFTDRRYWELIEDYDKELIKTELVDERLPFKFHRYLMLDRRKKHSRSKLRKIREVWKNSSNYGR